MSKSVYSLVLMDEVVEAIDALAYARNTSRSNLINQILAERVALTTPEMEIQTIFESMTDLLEGYKSFQIQQQASDSILNIRSVLKYKYNPTIKYGVNLYREPGCVVGELKIISRTQSDILHSYLYNFFILWSQLERSQHLPEWHIEEGKWQRKLVCKEPKEHYTPQQVAESLTHYLTAIDKGLKIYFSSTNDLEQATHSLIKYFNAYILEPRIIL